MWLGRTPIPTRATRSRPSLRIAAGRLVLPYLPTYGPWLNPIEMLWPHFRREATHCELFENIKALIAAAYDFSDRYNRCPGRVLSIIGSDPAEITWMYFSGGPRPPGLW
jgi:hypothetical protein